MSQDPDIAARVEALIGRGVRFDIEDGKLAYRAEPGAMTEADLRWLAANAKSVAVAFLERRLRLAREKYRGCLEFDRMPHCRTLSPETLAARDRAFQRMEADIRELEAALERLNPSP